MTSNRENYTGTGYLSSPLICAAPKTVSIQNSDGRSAGTASEYNCSLSPTTNGAKIRFSGYSPEPPIMPHTYYEKSCTLGSFLNTTGLELQDYVVERVESSSTVTFKLRNPGTGDLYSLNQMPVADDGEWHDCVAGSGEVLPWQLATCRYSLDRKLGKLGFHIQWYCDDRDPNHA